MEPTSSQQRGLTDLPTGALGHLSSYLALPSRALLAVALNFHDVERSSVIVDEQRDVLDFSEIESDLATKLNDDDIKGVLLSLDAIDSVKVLRLTNCLNISGVGLEPLRGSTFIEKIDLSLVGEHESPQLDPESPIAYAEILPSLDSIIERGGDCSLKLLVFPKKWREERNTESDFHAFLTRYDAYLSTQAPICLKCNDNLSQDMLTMTANQGRWYGKQNATCYGCMKHYCYECEDEQGVSYMGSECHTCERGYCLHCKTVKNCNICERPFCVDCDVFKQCFDCACNLCCDCASGNNNNSDTCRNCEKVWCWKCTPGIDGCETCGVDIFCPDCRGYDEDYCHDCDRNYCGQCLISRCNDADHHCAGCYKIAYSVILRDKERMQTEINELKRKVKNLDV